METKTKPLKTGSISEDEKKGVLERIAEDTVKEILGLPHCSRPMRIQLYGTNSEDLTEAIVYVQRLFKEKSRDYSPEVFIGPPLEQIDMIRNPTPTLKSNSYSVNVGYYLPKD